nr:MAG TPA: hypothetical protein [Caudoviricetes sp.]
MNRNRRKVVEVWGAFVLLVAPLSVSIYATKLRKFFLLKAQPRALFAQALTCTQ